jgi:uncharacterized protein (DUF697 family)
MIAFLAVLRVGRRLVRSGSLRVLRPHRDDEKGFAMAQKSTASAETEEAAADMTPEQRAEMAGKLVERFAIWSGVAGLVPLPGIDVVAVGGLQVQMLRRISQIYDVPFSENSGKALIAALAGSLIPASSGLGAASALKFVPIAGPLAAAFVMPALSAGATYARPSFSTLPRAARCSISTRRIIASSSRRKKRSGTRASHPAPAPTRPRERRQAVLEPYGCMRAYRGAAPLSQAPRPSNGEANARSYHLHNLLRSHRALRQRPSDGLFGDVSSRARHHAAGGAAYTPDHRAIAPLRVAPPDLTQLSFRGRYAHPPLSRRWRLVEV